MAQYTFDFRNAQNIDDLKLMLNKYFEWFFDSLDHLNVKQLFTEYCNIQSENGETVLNGTQVVMKDGDNTIRLLLGLDKTTGNFIYTLKDINGNETFSVSDIGQLKLGGRPLIEMYDNQATPVLRLRMGFDSVTNKFVFQMYDESGVETIGISSSGKGVITGGEIIGSKFRGTSANSGYAIIGNIDGNVGDLSLMRGNSGGNFFRVYDDAPSVSLQTGRTGDNWDTFINSYNGNTIAYGSWNFSSASSVNGLQTSSDGLHNHGIPDGTLLGVVDISGNIVGAIEFTASGTHFHAVNKA